MSTIWVSRLDYALGKRGLGIIDAIHNYGHPSCSRGCNMAAFYYKFNTEDVEKDNAEAKPLEWICTRHNLNLKNPKNVRSFREMIEEMEKPLQDER